MHSGVLFSTLRRNGVDTMMTLDAAKWTALVMNSHHVL